MFKKAKLLFVFSRLITGNYINNNNEFTDLSVLLSRSGSFAKAKKNTFEMVGWFMVFNATINSISAISWRSVLLVEETRRKPSTCRKSLTNFIT